MKTCSKCHKAKPSSDFPKDLRYKQCHRCRNRSSLGTSMISRTCSKCGASERDAPFPESRKFKQCRACISKRITAYNRTSQKYKDYQRNYHMKRNYGITVEEYERKLKEQGGVCAICKRPPIGRYRLSVDHNGTTKQVRGLLCNPCNGGMGRFEDSPERMETAVKYLRRWASEKRRK